MLTLLPVVDRELRVCARRSRTYWVRLAAAIAAITLCIWVCFWMARREAPTTTGRWLFSYLTVLAMGYALLVGPFITADCLSEEKREGTLGLLFLTDLRSFDVVLGKWLANSLNGLYGLLAVLPTLGIPLLLGGVTPGEYGRTALAVVNAILFSLTAGMFVSAISRDQAKAILTTMVFILGLSGLLPGLETVLRTGFFKHQLASPIISSLFSPAYTAYLASDAGYRAGPNYYWISLGLVYAFAWALMLATAIVVPRTWQEAPEEKPVTRRWLWRLGYTRGWRRTFRRRLEKNPVFAVAARLRWPHFVFWSLLTLVAINVYWLTYGYRLSSAAYQFHQYFSNALVFTNRVWLCVMSCRFWLEARRCGALELILTSPVPVKTILRGQWRALTLLFGGPVFIIALLHVFYVEESIRQNASRSAIPAALIQMYAMSAARSFVNFFTDVFAIAWVGAWVSLSSRRPTFAILKTFALVILIPWTISVSFTNLSSLLPVSWMNYLSSRPSFRGATNVGLATFSLLATGGWVAKNLAFIFWARWGLRRHFRTAAAGSYHARRRWWQRRRSRPTPPSEFSLPGTALGTPPASS